MTVMFNGVSTNGSSIPQIQLGDSGGVETSAYSAMTGHISNLNNTTRGVTATSGFILNWGWGTSETLAGNVNLVLLSSNIWTCNSVLHTVQGGGISTVAGSKTLSDTLTQLRITTVNGTDTFDAGSINILYEG